VVLQVGSKWGAFVTAGRAKIPPPWPRPPATALEPMLEALYPRSCVACRAALGTDPGPLCPTCHAELAVQRRSPALPGLQEVFTVDRYDGPIGQAVAQAKRGNDRERLLALRNALAQVARPFVAGSFFDAVVPCPSPWTRRLRRGFSPAHLLAHQVSAAHGLPLIDALAVAPGQRQSSLGRADRATNLGGRLRQIRPTPGRILLVDDVVTTGATLQACAQTLVDADAIWALALCRVQRDGVPTSRTTDEGP